MEPSRPRISLSRLEVQRLDRPNLAVNVCISDNGPHRSGRIIDLTPRAAAFLGMGHGHGRVGLARVVVRFLAFPNYDLPEKSRCRVQQVVNSLGPSYPYPLEEIAEVNEPQRSVRASEPRRRR